MKVKLLFLFAINFIHIIKMYWRWYKYRFSAHNSCLIYWNSSYITNAAAIHFFPQITCKLLESPYEPTWTWHHYQLTDLFIFLTPIVVLLNTPTHPPCIPSPSLFSPFLAYVHISINTILSNYNFYTALA